jgi:hypothetical protein
MTNAFLDIGSNLLTDAVALLDGHLKLNLK